MYIQYVNVITYLYDISSLQKQYCVLYICFDSYSALYTRLISLHWKITQYPHVTCSFKPPLLGASTLYLPSPKVVTKSHAILQLQKRSVGPRCYSIYIYIYTLSSRKLSNRRFLMFTTTTTTKTNTDTDCLVMLTSRRSSDGDSHPTLYLVRGRVKSSPPKQPPNIQTTIPRSLLTTQEFMAFSDWSTPIFLGNLL